jgi:signal transduction histidine kinase
VIIKYLSREFIQKKKHFLLFTFISIILILTGFLTPILIESKKTDWENILPEKTESIANSIKKDFKSKEATLLNSIDEIKKLFGQTPNSTYVDIFQQIDLNYNKSDLAIGFLDSNYKIISWNDSPLFSENIDFKKIAEENETFFYRSALNLFILYWEKLEIENSNPIYLLAGLPLERYFSLNDKSLSFKKELENNYNTEIDISYIPYTAKTKDGRKYSVELLNNNEKKIGLVTFSKPILKSELTATREKVHIAQSILIIIGFFLFIHLFSFKLNGMTNRLFKTLLLLVYIITFRVIIYVLGIPSKFLSGEIVNPSNFSSAFGFGIAKSPIELLLTTMTFLVIAIVIYKSTFTFYSNKQSSFRKSTIRKIVFHAIPLLLPLYFLLIRAFASATKSIVFDSTLNYFESVEIIPTGIHVLMIGTLLLIATFFVLLLQSIKLLLYYYAENVSSISKIRIFYLLFTVVVIFSFLFVMIQKEPLLTFTLYLITTALLFLLVYPAVFSKSTFSTLLIYSTIAGSIISITFLNHFNSELEKRGLKTSALTLNRANKSYLTFLIQEALISASQNEELISTFTRSNPNYNASAFIVWNQSSFYSENINSSIILLNKQRKVLGKFLYGKQSDLDIPEILKAYLPTGLKIFELEKRHDKDYKKLAGIIPILEKGVLLGYAAVIININEYNYSFSEEKIKYFHNATSGNLNQRILIYENDKLTYFTNNFEPSDEISKKILNSNYQAGENWLSFKLRNEDYLAFALNHNMNGSNRITVIALKEKELTWGLFNFFKLLITHSILILFLYVIQFLIQFRKKATLSFTFRTQIFSALLIVSILPIIALAVYNRYSITFKSESIINDALIEKAELLITHLTHQKSNNPNRTDLAAFEKASNELGISFRIFKDNSTIYSTENQLVSIGLISNLLPMIAYKNILQNGYSETFTTEMINDIPHYTLYRKMTLASSIYVIEINDAFNSIKTTLSPVEVDIFLFGIYSFAIVFILLLSTIIANRISSPIRKLTAATKAVAHGDFSIELENKEKGEIKELINGFNKMTSELVKNQKELTQLERENAWKDMAKQVAHEIKNPLTPMKLMLQQLIASYNDKTKPFDSIFDKVTKTLLNQIDTLNQIASEFSNFARMPNFHFENFNVITLLSESILLFNETTIRIKLVKSEDFLIINSDASQFRRMIINFIRNSVQAEANNITIEVIKINNFIMVDITDDGLGIPSEHIHKIFSLDFSTKKQGMGIGLKLAKRFIEGTGGQIILKESIPGSTTFSINLPIGNI